jgi:hypothetical protein
MPWRVLILGKSAGDIAMSTLVTDLAPPSRVKDTEWIKPGRASWAWWAYPEGPTTTNLFDQYTDFAADIVKLARTLRRKPEARNIADQMSDAATAIAANYRAVTRARSTSNA